MNEEEVDMNEVKINEFEEPVCCLFGIDGLVNGLIKSYLSLLDVRCQIKQKHLNGYYILWIDSEGNIKRIKIDESGELDSYPKGFYDESIRYLLELV
jgi:predicted ATPase